MKNYKDGDRIRIWIEDSVKPEGGTWCYGKIEEIKIVKIIFAPDDYPFEKTDLKEFKRYKIEKIL